MEQEKQSRVIQDIINEIISSGVIYGAHYQRDNNISQYDWHDIVAILIQKRLIEDNDGHFCLTNEGKRFLGDRYLQAARKENEEKQMLKAKQEKKEKEEAEKRQIDLKQARRQDKIFWPGFIIAVVGGLLGLTTFIFNVTKETKIEVKYIGVDSKGHVIEFTAKKD